MRALLDVNVLIALHDQAHVHHGVASEWFVRHIDAGWSSCPLTQNGFVRIMAQPNYAQPKPLSALIDRLREATASPAHAFWPDDLSLVDADRFHQPHIHSPRQLTDLYLLALAVKNEGRLVSFDLRVPLSAVKGATKAHLATP